MNRIILATLALMATSSLAHAQDHGPEAVASTILNAFVARDVATIGAHSSAFNEGFFARVQAGEVDGSSVFNGLEGRAATQWDGLILPARYDDGYAIVPFAIEVGDDAQSLSTQSQGRLIAIILTLDGPDDRTWGIDDLDVVQPEAYMAFSETRP